MLLYQVSNSKPSCRCFYRDNNSAQIAELSISDKLATTNRVNNVSGKEINEMKLKGIGLFALGTLFGLEGIKLLSCKDAKKLYAHCTAGVLRAKDVVLDQVTTLQENCTDIYEEAKEINEERSGKENETEE